jgi:hypothetical protein
MAGRPTDDLIEVLRSGADISTEDRAAIVERLQASLAGDGGGRTRAVRRRDDALRRLAADLGHLPIREKARRLALGWARYSGASWLRDRHRVVAPDHLTDPELTFWRIMSDGLRALSTNQIRAIISD